jgi:uncharacterized membrane protein
VFGPARRKKFGRGLTKKKLIDVCYHLLSIIDHACFQMKLDQIKQKNVELEAENRSIRESKVRMQLRVEQEEEVLVLHKFVWKNKFPF